MSRTNASELKATISDGRLVIEIPATEQPGRSSSGKTLLVASSRGPCRTSEFVEGKPVYVNLNAFIYP